MKKNLLMVLISTFFLVSCLNDSECDPCFTPPEPFYFEIKDATTDENIFTSGAANSSDLKLINESTGENMEFDFISENDVNIVMINSIGWKTETVSAKLLLNDDEIFTLMVDADRKSNDCCSWTRYNNIEIQNADFTKDNNTDTYIVYY